MSKNPTSYDQSPDARTLRKLAIVVRELLKANPEIDSGELADLVKDRLVRLRLPWLPWHLHHVLERIDRRPYTPRPPPPVPVRPQQDPPWGPYDRGPAQWTSLHDLATRVEGDPRPTTRD